MPSTDDGREAGKYIHLLVEARYIPWFWMHLCLPVEFTLEMLDSFLRDTWLECCGHLSQFTIGNTIFTGDDDDWSGYPGLNYRLGDLVSAGTAFNYEYDFGSTTELGLKVLTVLEARQKDRPVVLARNEQPEVPCDECGKPATQLCAECIYDGNGRFCDTCASDHGCGEEMLLPIVNSPRAGVCGYTGPAEEPYLTAEAAFEGRIWEPAEDLPGNGEEEHYRAFSGEFLFAADDEEEDDGSGKTDNGPDSDPLTKLTSLLESMRTTKRPFHDPSMYGNIYFLHRVNSMADFLPFIGSFAYLTRELDDDYLFDLLNRSLLPERTKIALATAVIHNADFYFGSNMGSLFTYFRFKMTLGDYPCVKEVKDFILHAFYLFFSGGLPELVTALLDDHDLAAMTSDMKKAGENIQTLLLEEFEPVKRGLPEEQWPDLQLLLEPKRTMPFSKVPIRNHLALLFDTYPEIIAPFMRFWVNILASGESKEITKDWVTSIGDYLADYPSAAKNPREVIDCLESLMSSSVGDIRLGAYMAAWRMTGDTGYLVKGQEDPAKRVRERCNRILNNPNKEIKGRDKRLEKEMKKRQHSIVRH